MIGRRRSTRTRVHPVNRDGHAIGLDIGATSVRAAILAFGATGTQPSVTVHGVGSVPLRAGAVINGVVMDPGAVTDALKTLWTTGGFNCKRVILGVANPQVVVRPLEIPDLTDAQRAKALPFQARDLIALPLDQVILDYAQVGPPDPRTGTVSGLLIATPRVPVLAAVEAIEKAGLRVARVDLASFGALRSIADQHLGVQAVIDVGAHLTSIVIHHHGVPRLVRTIARGGEELTEQLAERLNLTLDGRRATQAGRRPDRRRRGRRRAAGRPCDRCWPRSAARSTTSAPATTTPGWSGSR